METNWRPQTSTISSVLYLAHPTSPSTLQSEHHLQIGVGTLRFQTPSWNRIRAADLGVGYLQTGESPPSPHQAISSQRPGFSPPGINPRLGVSWHNVIILQYLLGIYCVRCFFGTKDTMANKIEQTCCQGIFILNGHTRNEYNKVKYNFRWCCVLWKKHNREMWAEN